MDFTTINTKEDAEKYYNEMKDEAIEKIKAKFEEGRKKNSKNPDKIEILNQSEKIRINKIETSIDKLKKIMIENCIEIDFDDPALAEDI